MTEIITYDVIRNVHRMEKNQITLQKLPENFFFLARKWLEQKQELAKKETVALLEIENAKKLIDDLINRRERKIVISALHTVRGGLPPENLTLEEEKFFDEIVEIFKKFKKDMQEQVIGKKTEKVKYVVKKKTLKIKTDLPKFVGSDLKEYGPYKTGETVEVPEDLAEVLIKRSVAESCE